MGCLAIALVLAQAASWQPAARILGREGSLDRAGVYRVSMLRTDLQIENRAGMLVPPEMGLASSVAFSGTTEQAVTSGELCVVANEIDDTIDRLRTARIDVIALHGHMAGESPAVYFVGFRATGNALDLARGLRSALDELAKDRPISEGLRRTGEMPIVDWKAVEAILGRPVVALGASKVMKATRESGGDTAGWAAFGGCSCGKSMLFGVDRMADSDLQATIDALRRARIGIAFIEVQGQTAEVRFEGEGDALRLASGVRAAWDAKRRVLSCETGCATLISVAAKPTVESGQPERGNRNFGVNESLRWLARVTLGPNPTANPVDAARVEGSLSDDSVGRGANEEVH